MNTNNPSPTLAKYSLLALLFIITDNTLLATEIEEVVVTAQKRSQAITDIGMSITAITGEQMDSLGFTSTVDVAAHTPGLTAQYAGANSTPLFAIRGMGLDDVHINNNSSVGIYVNGVFASSPIFLQGQLYDIERVEVLKGPQGTLYGKNSAGGVINFINRKPTSENEGYLTAGYGRWDTFNVKGAISGPLSDRVRARVALLYNNGGDWQEDLDNGNDFGDTEQLGLRGILTFDATENFSATITAHYSKEESTPLSPHVEGTEIGTDFFGGVLPGILDFLGEPIGGLLDTGSTDPRDVRVGALEVDRDDDGHGISLQWTWEAENFTVNSITAWDRYDHFIVDNIDGNPAPNIEISGLDARAKQFYQEVRIQSSLLDRIDWIAGFNFSTDEVKSKIGFDFSMLSFIQTTVFDTGLFSANSDFSQETDSLGFYLHTETQITDQLELIAGIRYSSDERSFMGTGTNTFAGFNFVVDAEDAVHDESDLSYRLGLEYQFNDDWMLYGNVATGYKNGIFFSGPPLTNLSWSYVDPEEVFGYEFGFKASLFNNSLNLNAAYFHYDLDNRQTFLLFSIPPGILEVGLDNVPESEIDGAEMELVWHPVEGLNINFGLAYLDTAVTQTVSDVRGFPLAAPLPVGESLSLAPEWSYNALVSYTTNFSNDYMARVQMDYSYRDSVSGALSDPTALAGPRNNLGARISFGPASEKWVVSVWGRNLTNENDDVRSYTDFFGGRIIVRQLPRTYGAEITYNFF